MVPPTSPSAPAALTAVIAVLVVGLTACSGSSNTGEHSHRSGAAGGDLTYFTYYPVDHLDPQRTYVGQDLANLRRTVYRSLVAFPTSTDPTVGLTPVPDLATDTGTPSNGGKTWSFTIKDDVTWQDGKPVTCEDFKYGASRVFATDVITGGPNYILSYLDIPTDAATGLPAYEGPYSGEGQKYFDKAVVCDGNTITYHFNKPWPDFPLAVASLLMMDPYRRDKDQGSKSNYQVFSNGPYRLDGTWSKNDGGTLVRNDQYDPGTDDLQIRRALPDTITFVIGIRPETQYDRLIADRGDDQATITCNNLPPAYYNQIEGDVAERSVLVDSPYVDYLVPNFKTTTGANPTVRRALALATDADAYVVAYGGDKAGSVAESVVSPTIPGYQDNPAFDGDNEGDPAAARELLEDAGVPLPVHLTYTYPSNDSSDKAAAALKETWDDAGFDVSLDPLGDTYYSTIQKPDKDSDVILASWGADWPSAITVTPPLFDSRPNLTENSNGADFGGYESTSFNRLVDQAQNASTVDGQIDALQRADLRLGQDVAYIPVAIQRFYYVYGSRITNFAATPAATGYPDLGVIGVQE